MSAFPYLVIIGDAGGEFLSARAESFREALHIRDALLARYPHAAAFVNNTDRVDVGNDGLTQEERDEL